MKRLLLFLLFSASLSAFCQVPDTTQSLREYNWSGPTPVVTPDTLRATLIVYYDSGPAILHTKPGFVVRGEIFLDDRKKVIKAPWEVYGYKIKR